MLKFVGKALAGLVLTKEAQEAVGHIAKVKVTPFSPTFPFPGSDAETAVGATATSTAMTAETPTATAPKVDRAELIRHAMSVRAAKQGVLADLDPESRSKLVALAMRALLNEGPLKG